MPVDLVNKILQEKNLFSHRNQGILACVVENTEQGVALAANIVLRIVDKKTALFLSGGRTPKELYKQLAHEELSVGAVGMVDERYEEKFHKDSNELMIKGTGLLRILDLMQVPFYPILNPVISRSETTRNPITSSDEISHFVRNDNVRERLAEEYDQKVRKLLATFQTHVAILGVGIDGHTAGIPAKNSLASQGDSLLGVSLQEWLRDFYERSKSRMVIDYDDSEGFYKERITMTFGGLSMMDMLLVLVFGEDKKNALELMFSYGSETDVPSRFFKRPEIAKKTLLITDQEIV